MLLLNPKMKIPLLTHSQVTKKYSQKCPANHLDPFLPSSSTSLSIYSRSVLYSPDTCKLQPSTYGMFQLSFTAENISWWPWRPSHLLSWSTGYGNDPLERAAAEREERGRRRAERRTPARTGPPPCSAGTHTHSISEHLSAGAHGHAVQTCRCVHLTVTVNTERDSFHMIWSLSPSLRPRVFGLRFDVSGVLKG